MGQKQIQTIPPNSDIHDNPMQQSHFFVCSFTGGHLGRFCVLAVVNSTAVNLAVPLSFCITVLCDICPGGELLDHVLILSLAFKGPSMQFPHSGCTALHPHQ